MEGTIEGKRVVFERDLLEIMTCPICVNYFTSPILMCDQGHSICIDCFQRILVSAGRCPTCRAHYNVGVKRNYAAETMLAGLKVPCKYTAIGCCAKLEVATRNEHEHNCQFNTEVTCPMMELEHEGFDEVKECSWVGTFSSLLQHVSETHGLQTEVYRSAAKLTFDEIDVSFFRPYLKFRLLFLQNVGIHVLVMLGNIMDALDIIVTALEFNDQPRVATILVENPTHKVNYSRSIYGMKVRRNQGDAGFMLSERDFGLFCTGSTFSFSLSITDRFNS